MKRFGRYFFIALLFLTIPFSVGAQKAPQELVWVEPSTAKAGEAIELSAFVYNESTKTATVTVSFTNEGREIAATTITIAPSAGKVAVGAWQMPKEETTITASVIKAIDASKQPLPELIGTIGTITLGAGTSLIVPDEIEESVKGWISTAFASIEPWRKKYALYFAMKRDQKKDELGVNTPKDLLDEVQKFEAPEAPGQIGDAQHEPTLADLQKEQPKFLSYFVLLYSTALASIFSSIAMFYITGILLLIFVIKFLFGLFR